MLFRIRHVLRYAYERPVFLEPTTLRLTPRQDAMQKVLSHEMRVLPRAAGETRVLEADGNEAVVLWFDEPRDQLTVEVDMEVETLRYNPFDWIVTHGPAMTLPVTYPEMEHRSLAGCVDPRGVDPEVAAWAAEQAGEVGGRATDFLVHLAATIHREFHHVGRPEGEALPPSQTLEHRTGACRDTALLYVAACRSQGLAARFVSGYSMHHPPEVSEHELHAWAEVYVPGGGWRGYDPSLGLAVADGHVVLAAAPDPLLAAPFSGHYRGTGVGSSLDYRVELHAADATSHDW
jgi:transglutaminase-like putative cysteine protease